MTDQEVTQQFFEAIKVGLRSIEENASERPEEPLRWYLETAVHSVFAIMDGVAGYSDLPAFDVTCEGHDIAPEDYIHEAWGKFCKGR